MSIIINGMKMPKDGECIVIASHGTAYKYERGDVVMYGDAYNETASAAELPPHGRLIEDTAVQEQIDEWLNTVGDVVIGHGLSYYGELMGCVEDAPTIIPAEEEPT